MMQLVEKFILPLTQMGVIPQDTLKQVAQQVLKTYEYGATAEFMQGVSENQNASLTDDQITAMKIALVEVMGDLMKKGVMPDQDQRIMEQKVAAAEAIKDTGAAKPEPEDKNPSMSIPYKDLPPEGKSQMAQQAGIDITADEIRQAEDRISARETATKILNQENRSSTK
jgi:hypothetical protein